MLPCNMATAAFSAISWAAKYPGDLHLWVDNQTVVDCLRALIQNTGNPDMWEHVDLWRQIDALLRRSVASIYVHKVDSHQATEHSTGPVADFAITWNAAADRQAKIVKCSRLVFSMVFGHVLVAIGMFGGVGLAC